MRVFVVDDDDDLLESIAGMFELSDDEVILASNGEQALAWLLENASQPDVILSDPMMPVLDGCCSSPRLDRTG